MTGKRDRSPFGLRLWEARTNARLSQKEVAEAIGISQSALSELETSGTRSGWTAQLAALYKCHPTWLATGAEQSEHLSIVDNTEPRPDARGRVPLISWVQAGELEDVNDHHLPGNGDEFIEVYDSRPGAHAFALRVAGDSMTSPVPGALSFPDGTIIIVDPSRGGSAGDFVVAKDVQTQQATFKKLTTDGGRWFLRPLNPAYPTLEIDDPSIRVIGKVTEYQIRGKL